MPFSIPNIYQGNYSRLVVFPLLLIAISLFFIPSIPYGIDFKGGTLLTMQLSGQADEGQLRTALDTAGLSNYQMKLYQNPAGWVAEIEMLTDERMAEIDRRLDDMDAVLERVDAAEAELARLRAQYESSPTPELAARISDAEGRIGQELSDARQTAERIVELSRSLAGGQLVPSPDFDIQDAADVKRARKAVGDLYLEARGLWRDKIVDSVKAVVGVESYSLEQVSPTLSTLFIEKVIGVAVWSFGLAIILIIAIFRNPLPSLIVLSGATADLMISLGAMGAFGIPMTLASFAALMMMVALSLDTDMMLTIKTLKHTEGSPRERAHDAFKTGFAMTTTTISAFAILLILGIITKIPVYYQIGAIGVVGLIGDLIATWGLNAILVLWHLEGKFGEVGGKVGGALGKFGLFKKV